jgi:hypothetical protein
MKKENLIAKPFRVQDHISVVIPAICDFLIAKTRRFAVLRMIASPTSRAARKLPATGLPDARIKPVRRFESANLRGDYPAAPRFVSDTMSIR